MQTLFGFSLFCLVLSVGCNRSSGQSKNSNKTQVVQNHNACEVIVITCKSKASGDVRKLHQCVEAKLAIEEKGYLQGQCNQLMPERPRRKPTMRGPSFEGQPFVILPESADEMNACEQVMATCKEHNADNPKAILACIELGLVMNGQEEMIERCKKWSTPAESPKEKDGVDGAEKLPQSD